MVLSDKPTILVDGDILAYRASAAMEKTRYLVEYTAGNYVKFDNAKTAKDSLVYATDVIWKRTELGPVEQCYRIVDDFYKLLGETFSGAGIESWLSGGYSFRDSLWRTKKYKGNRNVPKPTHHQAVVDFLTSSYSAVISDGEADDAIGSRCTALGERNAVIGSIDKDLDQLSGWHYDLVKKEIYYVSRKDADVFLFEQILSGDATDNVPGLDGIGSAKARKAMAGVASFAESFERCRELYLRAGHDERYFWEQAELIYIRRDGRTFKEYVADRLQTKSADEDRKLPLQA